jgi:hypothetical protein
VIRVQKNKPLSPKNKGTVKILPITEEEAAAEWVRLEAEGII